MTMQFGRVACHMATLVVTMAHDLRGHNARVPTDGCAGSEDEFRVAHC